MNKTEYVQIIEKALVGNVSPQEVQETVAYYRDYIDMEIRKGRSEQEVLEQLGNPRLLVKSIIAAKEQRETNEQADEVHEERAQGKSFRIPLLVVVLIALLLVGLVLALLLTVARILLPVLVPVLFVIGTISMIKKFKKK